MALTIRCPKHPRYTGEKSPRACCEPCVALEKIRKITAPENRVQVVERSKGGANGTG